MCGMYTVNKDNRKTDVNGVVISLNSAGAWAVSASVFDATALSSPETTLTSELESLKSVTKTSAVIDSASVGK